MQESNPFVHGLGLERLDAGRRARGHALRDLVPHPGQNKDLHNICPYHSSHPALDGVHRAYLDLQTRPWISGAQK